MVISTHSLTKRLTSNDYRRFLGRFISTHSLTKRLTVFLFYHFKSILYFNSQPHEEADVKVIVSSATKYDISTHSLTKRLTFRTTTFFRCKDISTHSLTKRLTVHKMLDRYFSDISTHSLTKRLTDKIVNVLTAGIFQLTASRRG